MPQRLRLGLRLSERRGVAAIAGESRAARPSAGRVEGSASAGYDQKLGSLLVLDGELAVIMRQGAFTCAAVLALSSGLVSLADGKTREDCEREYTPQRGQEGKDVIWVPTADEVVARMLELANVTSADKVYDLGAGDGKIPIAAGKQFGATAVGVEYDADLVKHAQCLVEAEGVQDRVNVIQGDIFETDFNDATVVTLYLLPELNLRLRPTLLDMRPGTRVVSYSFSMRDWAADEIAETDEGLTFLWIVPAKVGGAWTFRPRSGDESFRVTFDQTFQSLTGIARGARLTGKLSGRRIEFAFQNGDEQTSFTGVVEGDRISGTVVRGGNSTEHIGTRE